MTTVADDVDPARTHESAGYEALDRAAQHAHAWLDSLDARRVTPTATIEELIAALGADLPDEPTSPAEVIDHLAVAAEPGLTAMPSGRFFGFVIGGTHPAALAADWLVSTWDQNAGLRQVTPAHSAIEDIASGWLLDLPESAAVGFTTGATMANFTCLAAARNAVLRDRGWDVARDGLTGGPRVRVLVGAERHDTIDLALRYLGLGEPEVVAADEQGRIDPTALAGALATADGPTIVALQAGNVHSGAFDAFGPCIELARDHGAWVHVDGAFGLWAGVSPALRGLLDGVAGADSWTTDAHKTLNVPYDCGLAIVRDPAAMRAAMTMQGAYLIMDAEHGDPHERVPELSRRARAVPVWAVLRALGRRGVAELVERLVRHAHALEVGLRAIPGATVLNDVVFTQVCFAFESDDRTRAIARALHEDGEVWITGSHWRDRAVLRISVSNWRTNDDDVRRTLAALARAAAACSL